MRIRTTYRGYAAVFCQEAEVALERLRVAIGDAQRAGFLVRGTSAAYENAVELYARETGWTTKTIISFGSNCINLTNELQRAADRLNNEIRSVGGSTGPVYRPDYVADPGGWDSLPGLVKIVIIVGSIGLTAWGLSSVAGIASVFKPIRGMRGPVLDSGSKDRVQKRRVY
jgi:hypothetical protein